MVGAKEIEPTEGHDSHSAVFDRGVAGAKRDLDVRIVSPMTAPIAMMLRARNQRSPTVNNLLLGLGAAFRCLCCFFIALLENSCDRSGSPPWLCDGKVAPSGVFLGYQS